MRRKLVIVLLSLGTILGYAHGFRSLRHGGCHRERRQSFEQHVASLCVEAARRGDAAQAGAPPPDEGHHHGRHGHHHHHRHGARGFWGGPPDGQTPTVDTTALRDPFAPGTVAAPVIVPAVPAVAPPAAVVLPAAPAPGAAPVPLGREGTTVAACPAASCSSTTTFAFTSCSRASSNRTMWK